jgi:cytochrome P450
LKLDYDPFAEVVRNDPYPFYARLRDEAPAYFMEKYDAWAISRFQDIWDVCSSDALSVARGSAPGHILTKDQAVVPMINNVDPPEHTKLRSAIRTLFLPRNMRAVEPQARQLANSLLDEVADRDEFDIIGDFAARLSVTIACMAIGLPTEDGPMLVDWVQRFFEHDPDEQGFAPEGAIALQELTAYCEEKVKERRKNPVDSAEALSALATFEFEGQRYSDAAAASHVAMLVIGGSETFPKVLANGLRRLWEHPDQRAALVGNPEAIPDAFNEILRYDMPTQFLCRTVTRDLELHGETIEKGQGVIFLYASANRDEREFEDPDRFDIERRPLRILTFGAGAHQCLGTHVARMEGKVCLETILERFPEYALDLERATRFKTEFVQGFKSLPFRPRSS